ncbi:ras association domain-containing protein 5 isoform X1 [Alosa alosa]|uniref:ras association domain-containing protein 5 isoform X1 n=1 Tax=Alosa sapidissima TaxID=34773 RepID=UPI001C091116|nr:ras association domain-containing protein 5 isoform X1 [Alosa sapidissima]XP_048110974.1 ras association domain-containing protein 5 isoform X1 [Alosa alosa]
MASVTLGQHPAHHIDSEQSFFLRKLSKNKLLRKTSREKMMSRGSSVETESAAPRSPAAVSASLNHTQPPTVENGLSNRCALHGSPPPRSTDDNAVEDNGNVLEKYDGGACRQASMIVGKNGGKTGQNASCDIRKTDSAKPFSKNDADEKRAELHGHAVDGRRNSVKDAKSTKTAATHSNGHSVRRLSQSAKFRSLSAEEPDLEGLHLNRVTQGRTGIVRIMRSEPLRREAWSIFKQADPRVKAEKGEGHIFTSKPVAQDWCDACNRLISAEAVKCKNCNYTCHLECQGLVQLDCNQRDSQSQPSPASASTLPQQRHCPTPTQETNVTNEEEEEKPKLLSDEELKAKIEAYNSKVSENGMNLAADGLYTGFIKVQLRLRRPVTVSGRASFYLPSDAVKQIHISSITTVSEVIQGLLKKYTVLDNPQKFALYRRTHRDGQDLFQKLQVSEHPLYLRLVAGPEPDHLTFVLKENETGEVDYHAFSVPELQNFLTILEKEERERLRIVEHRYGKYRQKLLQALEEVQNKPG